MFKVKKNIWGNKFEFEGESKEVAENKANIQSLICKYIDDLYNTKKLIFDPKTKKILLVENLYSMQLEPCVRKHVVDLIEDGIKREKENMIKSMAGWAKSSNHVRLLTIQPILPNTQNHVFTISCYSTSKNCLNWFNTSLNEICSHTHYLHLLLFTAKVKKNKNLDEYKKDVEIIYEEA